MGGRGTRQREENCSNITDVEITSLENCKPKQKFNLGENADESRNERIREKVLKDTRDKMRTHTPANF